MQKVPLGMPSASVACIQLPAACGMWDNLLLSVCAAVLLHSQITAGWLCACCCTHSCSQLEGGRRRSCCCSPQREQQQSSRDGEGSTQIGSILLSYLVAVSAPWFRWSRS